MPRLVPLLLLAALTAPGAALAARRAPAVVEDALAFADTDRARAAALLDAAAIDASPRQLPEILLHAAEQRRLLGDPAKARAGFEAVLSSRARWANHEAAALGLALVDAGDGASAETVRALRELPAETALSTQNADRYLVLAIVAAAAGDEPGLDDARTRALAAAADHPDVYARVEAQVSRLSAAAEPAPQDGPVAVVTLDTSDLTDLEIAERALERGEAERVRELAARILANPASPEEALAASYLERRLSAVPVNPSRIGLLLPLSGRFEVVGGQVQQAFEHGWRREGGAGTLVAVDSGATPEEAVAALERLVLEQGVVAVAGPLLSDQADAVARAAQALRVPLVGLSQSMESREGEDWVVRAAVSVADQADALVAHAMDRAGMRAFAVFAPDNSYGATATAAFERAVAARGGSVVQVQKYDPESNNLTPFARELGRKDYEARREELSRLRRETAERGGDPSRVVLPPKLDFDGLFVPDTASRVPLACAALAFEEFPVGEFRTVRDGPTIPLLGLNGWNHPDLLTQGGPYVRSSLFTELFLPDDEAAAAFAERYRQDLGRSPSPLEAVVADAGRLVAAATRSGSRTRAAFLGAVLDAAPQESATGLTGVDREARAARHRVRILTITRDAIEPADGPEAPPPAP